MEQLSLVYRSSRTPLHRCQLRRWSLTLCLKPTFKLPPLCLQTLLPKPLGVLRPRPFLLESLHKLPAIPCILLLQCLQLLVLLRLLALKKCFLLPLLLLKAPLEVLADGLQDLGGWLRGCGWLARWACRHVRPERLEVGGLLRKLYL